MNEPKLIIDETTDPVRAARSRAQVERGKRNDDWLQQHWPDLVPRARGRFVAVAGQEAHISDTSEEAWQWAKTAHPDDDGAIVQYVRATTGPRVYANRSTVVRVR